MSKSSDPRLVNPLDHYRSYSYQFILSVANTTSAFEKMLGQDNAALLATVRNVPLGGQLAIPNEKAYLLVDTRRFSHYSITDVNMEHIYGTGGKSNPLVPAGSMSMRLIDTTGLSFFNFLMDILRNKLQTTRASAFFMLTVMFVGHKDDGTTETIVTMNTALNLLTLDFEFNSSGSTYNIEFMEIEGAPPSSGAMQYMNNLGDVTTISTKKHSNNLGGMIQSLEDALNIRSLEIYQKYSFATSKQQANVPIDPKTPKSGKLVQYMITIPDAWKNFPINAASRSVNVEQNFIHIKPQKPTDETKKEVSQEQVAQAAQDSAKHFSYTMGITDAIKSILETSKSILDLAETKDGNIVLPKIVTNVTSDAATYVIHFDVMEYRVPKTEKTSVVTAGSSNAFTNAPIIEYDYIFTGKNIDIKDLKIAYQTGTEAALDTNFSLGQTRLANNAAVGQIQNQTDSIKKGVEESKEFNPNIRPSDPVFFTNKSVYARAGVTAEQEAVKHTDALAYNKSKQIYSQTLAFMHFISSMEISMTIRGNPGLLAKFADRNQRGGIAPHTQIVSVEQVNNFNQASLSAAQQNFEQDVRGRISSAKRDYVLNYLQRKIQLSDPATSPLFVKINIRAPRVDEFGNPAEDGNMFTDEFFFKGTYMVLTIKSSFSNGEFSQDLTLIPMDITGAYSDSGSTLNR